MSKRTHHTDGSASKQAALFDITLSEGTFDVALGFRQTLSKSMHQSGKDRYQIAAEMSRLMQRDMSKEMLDKVCGSDPSYSLRAEALPALCHVIGCVEPLRYLVEPLDWDLLSPEDKDLVELARLIEQERTINQRIMQLRTKRGLK
jgi:hypothetical protein